MRRVIAVVSGMVLAGLPTIASGQAVGGSVTSFGPAEWLALVLRLGLVIGVIWGAVYAMRWYTRRAGGERPGVVRALDILETRTLGPNRALHVVRVGERAVVIGVTPERISTLMQIDEPEVLERLELTSSGTPRAVASFGALLAGLGVGSSRSARAALDGEAAMLTEASVPSGADQPQDGLAEGGLTEGDLAEMLGLVSEPRPDLTESELAEMLGVSSAAQPVAQKPSRRARKARRAEERAAEAALRSTLPAQRRRGLTERVLGALGFTPVESTPEVVARLRAQRAAAQAAMRTPMPVPMPIPIAVPVEAVSPAPVRPAVTPESLMPAAARGAQNSLFERIQAERDDRGSIAAVVAPTATQALRALSGYAAAQRTSHGGLAESMAEMESMDRAERIAEAQRAISAARMAG